MKYFRLDKPKLLSGVLQEYLNRHPQKKKLKQGIALAELEHILGKQLYEQCANIYFVSDGVLIIHVPDAVWRQEIHSNRFLITKKINELAKSKIVHELWIKS